MDAVKSFKGYGKIDELQQRGLLKKARARFLLLALLALVLFGILAAVIATVVHFRRNGRDDDGADSTPSTELTPASSLIAVCGVTRYPDSCFSSISALNVANSTDPEQLFLLSLMVAADELGKVADLPTRLLAKFGATRIEDGVRAALMNVCLPLLQDAADTITESIGALNSTGRVGRLLLNSSGIGDLRTQLSAALTDHETCIDSLTEFNATVLANLVRSATLNATQFTSNSLAIATRIISLLVQLNFPIHRRRLLTAGNGGDGIQKNCSKFQWDQLKKLMTPWLRDCDGGSLPGWVGLRERRMLAGEVTPDVTVAKDGSGDFKTISEAVAAAPAKNATGRFVIYVKEGNYAENVNIGKNAWNVMMYGDGKTRTVVSGSLNFIDGTPTFLTATFVVTGKGFIARDMGFENTAGAAKHQAVALRSGSDFSVFYRCSFDGFQDTLYAHSNRQFYRECDITGTIDFIFGNSAAIFQECNILPRQPMDNQFNTITAQGKTDVDQNTGISIQKCTISANGYVTVPTYLGRPWKNCSMTVVMQSHIDSFLNPKGWIAWVYGVDPPKTIFYGEYQNTGVGADTSQRITWAGYEAAMSDAEAEKFTVPSFIQGLDWLPQTSVTYDSSL